MSQFAADVVSNGNAVDFDGCPNTCGARGCGDGVVEVGELCDDGNKQNTDACLNDCSPARCGDGFVRAGVEACDDGDAVAGDGCSAACLVEGVGPPTGCGDGALAAGEECDDGGQAPGDGCSALCTKEFRRVFITGALYSGSFGGLAGADAACQAVAETAGLPGTFLAWLSDSASSPAARMVHSTVPYQRVDGVQVAADWDDLADGEIAAPFVTETGGAPLPTQSQCGNVQIPLAWTATSPAGLLMALDAVCDDWSSALFASGGVGTPMRVDGGWTAHCNELCANQAALYCVEN